jgi:hypothetical protein
MLQRIHERRRKNGVGSLEVGQGDYTTKDKNINYRMDGV